jgi:hypothetical protein
LAAEGRGFSDISSANRIFVQLAGAVGFGAGPRSSTAPFGFIHGLLISIARSDRNTSQKMSQHRACDQDNANGDKNL